MRKLQIENCKLRIANWKKSLALSCFGLAAACLFAGCPEQAIVTVTVKPVAGAAQGGGETATESTTAAGYGALVGTITYDGDPKPLPPLQPQGGDATLKPEDRMVCAAKAIPDESLEVNGANKGLANVVIFLEKRPANIKPELAKHSHQNRSCSTRRVVCSFLTFCSYRSASRCWS